MNKIFSDVVLLNQSIWDNYPEKATERALESLHTGGFTEHDIQRRVGNYEGQILAIRKGWVDKNGYSWRINEKGKDALKKHGKDVATILPVWDSWHNQPYEMCVFERTTHAGEKYLKLFNEAIPSGAKWGMDPILKIEHARVLRDFISEWIEKTENK